MSDFSLPTPSQSTEEIIESHELPIERQLFKLETPLDPMSRYPNSEHDQTMLQMFLTNTNDEYDLLMKQVIKPIMEQINFMKPYNRTRNSKQDENDLLG